VGWGEGLAWQPRSHTWRLADAGQIISVPAYADDTPFMFSSEDKIRPCLHSSSQAAATLGLKTSSAKTKLQNLGLQHEEFWFIL